MNRGEIRRVEGIEGDRRGKGRTKGYLGVGRRVEDATVTSTVRVHALNFGVAGHPTITLPLTLYTVTQ